MFDMDSAWFRILYPFVPGGIYFLINRYCKPTKSKKVVRVSGIKKALFFISKYVANILFLILFIVNSPFDKVFVISVSFMISLIFFQLSMDYSNWLKSVVDEKINTLVDNN